jgi:hypothetical protein
MQLDPRKLFLESPQLGAAEAFQSWVGDFIELTDTR